MLPLIPALLMLILNGPATADRPIQAAHWVEAIKALHACVDRAKTGADIQEELLEYSGSPEFAHALYKLLVTADGVDEGPKAASEPVERPTIRPNDAPIALPDGFIDGRRSRDGPASR